MPECIDVDIHPYMMDNSSRQTQEDGVQSLLKVLQ